MFIYCYYNRIVNEVENDFESYKLDYKLKNFQKMLDIPHYKAYTTLVL